VSIAVRVICQNEGAFGPEPPDEGDLLDEDGVTLLTEDNLPLVVED
jgi:hypothetical protein